MLQVGEHTGSKQDLQMSGTTVENALQQETIRMYGIETSGTGNMKDTTLGPTPTCRIYLDGTPTTALLDTGSPVSIISLDFFLKAAGANRVQDQSPVDRRNAVWERLHPSTMCLRSYSGSKLDIVAQAT